MDEGFLILAIVAIVAIILAGGLFITSSENNLEDIFVPDKAIVIDVVSADSLYNGDELSLKLTQNDVPLANKTIGITFIDAKWQKNTFNLTTNNQGIAEVVINNVTPGNYTVDCIYDDYDVFLASKTFNLNVKESPDII